MADMNAKRLAEIQKSYPNAFVYGTQLWATYRGLSLLVLTLTGVNEQRDFRLLASNGAVETLRNPGFILRISRGARRAVRPEIVFLDVVKSLCHIREANGVIEWGIWTREPTWIELANDDLGEILAAARE